eukprot:CAMPEP_0194216106 /NCGR_PEP_ID=MMETSP0156-20130528/18313_1 /TAXON_ID=33649 /ORGANISM="Thalassionema nitzschioides, Strain L26-B" /LENGTH=403 /DNA_ID=CAMNT_0038944795 /DNA_START=39 /DNA_END=1247 /DNA_ORIENTATION=+
MSVGKSKEKQNEIKREDHTPSKSAISWPLTIFASSFMGIFFGLAFYKSHVFEPQIIRGQFLFQRFIMLKVFFGAMGTGALLLAFLSGRTKKFHNARELWRPTASTRGYWTGPALGGFGLGVGMAISGACPGMVLAAWGADTPDCTYTIFGGLLGALVYGMNAELIQRKILDRGPKGPCSKEYADEVVGISYSKLATGLGIVCLLGCVVLEQLVPWKEEVPSRLSEAMNRPSCKLGLSFDPWECPAWPPSLAGCLVGSLQFIAVLAMETLLGSATAFQVCSSCLLLPTKLIEGNAYLKAFATPNPQAWWQLFYVGLAVVAAQQSAKADGEVGASHGVGPLAAFLGGFVLIFASRLGGGCTSGHGLSGCAILLVQSWVAVPAMFAGGIAVAVAWQMGVGGFFQPE